MLCGPAGMGPGKQLMYISIHTDTVKSVCPSHVLHPIRISFTICWHAPNEHQHQMAIQGFV